MKKSALLPYFFVVMLWVSCAQNSKNSIKSAPSDVINLVQITDAIAQPWGLAFLPDHSILITERTGTLWHYRDGNLTEITNVPSVYVHGQGGLMDVEVHPNFAENKWIYLSYSYTKDTKVGGNTAILRATLRNNQLLEKKILYQGGPQTKKGQHFGSRLEFDTNGYLYFSIGDRGNRNMNPQDVKRDGGKIYRINDDGSIPKDNPFVNTSGAKSAIFSYGHRNPQGLTLHPETGKLWEHEHGPRGGDEINVIEKGKNYGWPVITYGINYSGTKITNETSRPGMEQPIYQWTPSIAPSGMTFVSSKKYPDWKGDLLVGSLAFQYLELVEMDKNKVVGRQRLLDGEGRLRSVKQSPDGFIYVGIEGKGVFRLEPGK
ncbi:MAG: PQQ-dependent sugar dehydrogenase [Bacteroidota bacterium]